ncbi:MAG TPA: hypothetical protein VJP08_03855, partial [Actinomycetota bacterium]|nr:hypothetical protein [Actinomycetota bacterium]
MIVLPLLAGAIALAFAVHLLIRAGRRRSWSEAVWGVAMLMFATASGALFLGVLDGWSAAEFRVYWLFGAVLNVPYLAAGEVYLLARRPWVGHVALLAVLAATAWASAEVRTAPLDTAVLVLGILWSALGMRGRPELRNRFTGVLLIGVGALVVAGGAAFAAAGSF